MKNSLYTHKSNFSLPQTPCNLAIILLPPLLAKSVTHFALLSSTCNLEYTIPDILKWVTIPLLNNKWQITQSMFYMYKWKLFMGTGETEPLQSETINRDP